MSVQGGSRQCLKCGDPIKVRALFCLRCASELKAKTDGVADWLRSRQATSKERRRTDSAFRVDFEQIVARVFEMQYHCQAQVVGRPGDMFVDVWLRRHEGAAIIQCKRTTRGITAEHALTLLGALQYHHASRAFAVTTGEVRPDARKVEAAQDGIQLVDLGTFVAWVVALMRPPIRFEVPAPGFCRHTRERYDQLRERLLRADPGPPVVLPLPGFGSARPAPRLTARHAPRLRELQERTLAEDWTAIAQLWMELLDYDRGVRVIEKVEEHARKTMDACAYYDAGVLQVRNGLMDQARQLLGRAREHIGDNMGMRYLEAHIALARGEWKNAEDAFMSVLRQPGKQDQQIRDAIRDSAVLIGIGSAQYEQRLADSALEWFKTARDNDPLDETAQRHFEKLSAKMSESEP